MGYLPHVEHIPRNDTVASWRGALLKHATSESVGDLFVSEICLREGRGLPRVIISDHDALFTANFWRTMFKRFGTKLNFTHGARSQHSNGLAERTVAVVEEILRTRVNYRQDDWEESIDSIHSLRIEYDGEEDAARQMPDGS